MARRPVLYLDHHATTPLDPRVEEAMQPYLREDFGNPSSETHAYGWRAQAAVDLARETLAAALGASESDRILFTSGATESNNLALLGVARARRRGHLVTVVTEHPSVLEPCAALEREGFAVTRLPVDAQGLVDPQAVGEALRADTLLVSVMAANGEIGVLQPLEAIGSLCRDRGVPLHSDAAQAVGKIPLDLATLPVDLVSLSAHKVYGPKGVGALYVRRRQPALRLAPLLFGGGQQDDLRPGTVPVPLVVGLARAVELAVRERPAEAARLGSLRDLLWRRLRESIEGLHRNGHPTQRLPGNLNVSFEGVDGGALLTRLRDLALSAGSACASGKPGPSPVLKALGLPDDRAGASLRFGLGRSNTPEQIEQAASRVIEEVRRLRSQGARDAAPPARV